MTSKSQSWSQAFKAFLDRRALIMLFLGFSAGVPILLIFSSLSLWLGEAGVTKSAVTFFSWAALGYSFKFVWAPLIDELPVPVLTKKLGHRRAWLLVSQFLIIIAICIMAMSNPALGQGALTQMALGAVLLGFAGATQDIVIDAYRIELAETEMQTILASTYNAGYRIGMIIAGAGALFLAASLGTAKGNYIYEAWQYTYFAMGLVMVIGIITTLVIREPDVIRNKKQYVRSDYFRLVGVFFISLLCLIFSYIGLSDVLAILKTSLEIKSPLALFGIEAVNFLGAVAVAVLAGYSLVRVGAVNREMAVQTWVAPLLDFFTRYGVKVALALLLLIGFYRISDIIAGVISNVYYQDLNFSKEQIAEAVKVYGVIFSLVGGFLGGLLAQRMNVMKLMFVGAVLASSTNLIFIGLVNSGKPIETVQLQVGAVKAELPTDEIGNWSIDIPTKDLLAENMIQVKTAYLDGSEQAQVNLPFLQQNLDKPQLLVLPVTHNNEITQHEKEGKIVVRGYYLGGELKAEQKLIFALDGQQFDVNPNGEGIYTAAIDAELLAHSTTRNLQLQLLDQDEIVMQANQLYEVSDRLTTPTQLDIDVQPIVVDQDEYMTTLQGKVIQSYSSGWLYFAIIVDNLASGLAGAAFIAFLSSLTSVSFTAVQYALFSSLMTMTPKLLGGYSGTIVTNIGYPNFFLMTALIGIPILFLVVWVGMLLKQREAKN